MDESKSRWEAAFAAPDAITDSLGPTPKLARRVAIRTKDVITLRDATERSKTVRATRASAKVCLFADVCKKSHRSQFRFVLVCKACGLERVIGLLCRFLQCR